MKKIIAIFAAVVILCFSMLVSVPNTLAGDRTLRFNWDQNISSDFGGWKIYRSIVQGGPYAYIEDVVYVPGETVYTVDQVLTSPDGQTITYYFVLKAFDISENPSGDSNEASVIIDFEPPDAPFSLTITIVAD